MPTESLTAARVESLAKRPPAAGRVEVWDAKTPGLALRISATGAASWSFRYRPREGTGYRRVTLGKLGDLGLADARARHGAPRGRAADRPAVPASGNCPVLSKQRRTIFARVSYALFPRLLF